MNVLAFVPGPNRLREAANQARMAFQLIASQKIDHPDFVAVKNMAEDAANELEEALTEGEGR